MLKDLIILNGEMPLKFDPMNTTYTITVTNDDAFLKFEYEISDTDHISILGNNLKDGKNEIVITVFNDEESMSYYLYVYKEKIKTVNNEINNLTQVNVNTKEEVSIYAVPAISCICFLIILLFFTLLFKKKKKNKF